MNWVLDCPIPRNRRTHTENHLEGWDGWGEPIPSHPQPIPSHSIPIPNPSLHGSHGSNENSDSQLVDWRCGIHPSRLIRQSEFHPHPIPSQSVGHPPRRRRARARRRRGGEARGVAHPRVVSRRSTCGLTTVEHRGVRHAPPSRSSTTHLPASSRRCRISSLLRAMQRRSEGCTV